MPCSGEPPLEERGSLSHRVLFTDDGVREYRLYVPESYKGDATPLLL